jgi:HAD superfamily hydrolase (TIGR01458 family)
VTGQLLLIDLDGTLYDAGSAVPGAAEAMARLRADGHTVRFFTNTDSQSTSTLLARLHTLGFDVRAEELFTPVAAARGILQACPSPRALLLVTRPVAEELGTVCRALPTGQAAGASHVVIGDFRDDLSYAALDAAFRAVHDGATLLALQAGRYFRAADGPHLDTGALVAAVEYAAETTAVVLGKPSAQFLSAVIASAPGHFPPRATWVVGDDRATDVAMAVRAGLRSVQPRTGKHADQVGRQDLPAPEFVVDSVAALPGLLVGGGS